jgi:hypothetical protein
LETALKREFFTRHGLHLNGRGKDVVTKQVIFQINNTVEKITQTLISLNWKDNLGEDNATLTTVYMNITHGNMSNNPIDNVNCSTSSCVAIGNISNNEEVMENDDISSNVATTRRTSSRPQNVPVTRDSDFFMVTPDQNVTNNVSSDAKPDVDLSGKSSLTL